MLISVLLPTRDRLDLLRLAVESVRRQGYADYEIVISDNCSPPEVAAYIAGLNDERIVYRRFDTPVPVTENWNNALRHSRGDYVIMLGDDDALCDGYFDRIKALVETRDAPDCIYSGAYMFTYRGVIPGVDYGAVHENKNALFWRDDYRPYWLSLEQRLALVNDAMCLYSSYGFNMQFVTVSRAAVEALTDDEGFYKTQYPDYYAMNNLLLNTEHFLVVEEPLVTIGASPQSFGWYYQNRKEDSGNKVLNIEAGMDAASESIADVMLPGTSMNTNWLTSMIKLGEDNAGRAGLCQPDVRHYRSKQILYTVLLRANGAVAREELDALRSQLDARERMVYALLLPLVYLGAPGRRALSFLHVASQKRSGYLWHALVKRLFKRAPVTRFTHDANILETEVLLGQRS